MAEKKTTRRDRTRLAPKSVQVGDQLFHVSSVGRSALTVRRVENDWVWGSGPGDTLYVVPLSECVLPETLKTHAREIERRWGKGIAAGSSHDVD